MHFKLIGMLLILKVSFDKTKEIVFTGPSTRPSLPSPLVSAKLLGVTFSQTLSFDEHLGNILTICNQRLYLLKYVLAGASTKAIAHCL